MTQLFDIIDLEMPLAWQATVPSCVMRELSLAGDGAAPASLRQIWRSVPRHVRHGCARRLRAVSEASPDLTLLLPVMLDDDDGGVVETLIRGRVSFTADGPVFDGAICNVTPEMDAHRETVGHLQARADTAVRELNHRVRNIMSVVTALITLSARFAEDVESFSAATLARIQALNVAYSNTGIDPSHPDKLRTVVKIEALTDGIFARFRANGLPIETGGVPMELSPGQASALGLMLHEIASNAVEHGGLQHPGGGAVRLSWSGFGPDFEITWSEPMTKGADEAFVDGFGMTIIKLFAMNYLNGDAVWSTAGDRMTVAIRGRRNDAGPRPA